VAAEKFFVVRRSDGYIFIQRYVPRDYAETKFVSLGQFDSAEAAVNFLNGKNFSNENPTVKDL
jgi:hypothetical protein